MSHKLKIPIPDLNAFTDDHVLCKVWNDNYFTHRSIITAGSQNGNEINDSTKFYFFGNTNFIIVGSYTGTSFRT
jgi:hypothetical protein